MAEIGAEPVTVKNRTPQMPTACLRSCGTSARCETSKMSASAVAIDGSTDTGIVLSAMLRPLPMLPIDDIHSIDLQVFLKLPIRHVIRESLQLVAAHDGVRRNKLLPEQLGDAVVRFEKRERLLHRGRQLWLGLVFLRWWVRGWL